MAQHCYSLISVWGCGVTDCPCSLMGFACSWFYVSESSEHMHVCLSLCTSAAFPMSQFQQGFLLSFYSRVFSLLFPILMSRCTHLPVVRSSPEILVCILQAAVWWSFGRLACSSVWLQGHSLTLGGAMPFWQMHHWWADSRFLPQPTQTFLLFHVHLTSLLFSGVPVSLITIPSYMISGRGWMLPQYHRPRKVVYTK